MRNFLIDTANQAGLKLRSFFGKAIKRYSKDDFGDFVTTADYAAEKIILASIEKKFPHDNILSEEAGEINISADSEYTWIVDPLDGTKNFASGIPLFGTTIARMRKNEIVEAVIFNPMQNEMFYAKKGHGAFLNGRRIHASQKKETEHLMSGVGNVRSRTDNKCYDNIRCAFYKISSGFRVYGSAVIDLSYTACGRMDAFVLGGPYPWDIAAGGLIIQEAGGIITAVNGDKWDPMANKQEILVSGNKILHKKLLKIIKK
ncbi:MAG: inositol monophosphatase family protein [Patescibacteria group bacterium]|jgi:myo-inositol-1(or 4)-monophosphatase